MFLFNLDNNPKLMKNSVYYNFDYGVGGGGDFSVDWLMV